jgi:hypothetical protein
MATLDSEDIEAIATAVVRKLNMQSGVDKQRIADTMTLAERKTFWKNERAKEKRK